MCVCLYGATWHGWTSHPPCGTQVGAAETATSSQRAVRMLNYGTQPNKEITKKHYEKAVLDVKINADRVRGLRCCCFECVSARRRYHSCSMSWSCRASLAVVHPLNCVNMSSAWCQQSQLSVRLRGTGVVTRGRFMVLLT